MAVYMVVFLIYLILVSPIGLQEAAADRFDKMVSPRRENEAVEKIG